jgi:uncharacterized protein (TIGR03663 family)
MLSSDAKPSRWLDRRVFAAPSINLEILIFIIIFVLAVFSRFYILGERVMSHDENSHVYYSWRFFRGEGFSHDPLMHGPLQFHLLATSYFMFGDNDFTARIPAASFSVATVMFMWFYRRYLGRAGAIVAAILMLLSPYILFYGRYARNEAFIGLFGVVMLWAILRYLEEGKPQHLYILTLANVLHFTSKETSFIYSAQAMIFLAGYFIYRLSSGAWKHPEYRNRFFVTLIITLLFIGAAGGFFLLNHPQGVSDAGITASPAVPGQEFGAPPTVSSPPILMAFIILAVMGIIGALLILIRGFGWDQLKLDRSFGILIVLGTLVLPQLSAFPLRLLGRDIPTNASDVMALTLPDILWIGGFLISLLAISFVIGAAWNARVWLVNAAIWYGVFTVFYTSMFTNGAGLFTGMVGSLGYWLEQQGVERGSQPVYYYALVQMPVYEYLPAIGAWLAFVLAIFRKPRRTLDEFVDSSGSSAAYQLALPAVDLPASTESAIRESNLPKTQPTPVIALLIFWAATSLVAYSVAGEKMPWLTFHITLPAILCSGWSIGQLIDSIHWEGVGSRRGWLGLLLIPVFLVSSLAAVGALLGTTPPFQGKELIQLQATSQFLVSFLSALVSGIGVFRLLKDWPAAHTLRMVSLGFLSLLAVLTAHTTIQANFYNYDDANELLVYAHSAPGVKTALEQIEEISRRTTDGLDIQVAYDNETSYPYWWYLRDYPHAQYYGANPSRALREAPIILVGDANFGKIEPIVANLYDQFDYIRLWWPNQDYFDLSWDRIRNALSDPGMRSALFQIWLNRDYTKYGEVLSRDMSLTNWSPAARMRLYIRKDITSQLWNYGSVPVPVEEISDPFDGKIVQLTAETIIGSAGTEPGQFQRARDVAVAPDGTIYVADSENNRIQHINSAGETLQVWGTFGDSTIEVAPGGTFNQPWGIAVGPDGTVFVADTWNHRIQTFTPQGEFIKQWGYFGQAEQPEAFWGPRDLAVDDSGRVFVTDTGNKRVVVFSTDGEYITQFGGAGMGPGQLDEPVGIAVDPAGLVYVADTWNQRIQVFRADEAGVYTVLRSWELQAWYGQSLENKPFLSVDRDGNLFVSDPEGYRILQYSPVGDPIRSWGDFGSESFQFGMPNGLAAAADGSLWVADSGNNRIMKFMVSQP